MIMEEAGAADDPSRVGDRVIRFRRPNLETVISSQGRVHEGQSRARLHLQGKTSYRAGERNLQLPSQNDQFDVRTNQVCPGSLPIVPSSCTNWLRMKKLTKGKVNDGGIVAACIYVACRQERFHVLLKKFLHSPSFKKGHWPLLQADCPAPRKSRLHRLNGRFLGSFLFPFEFGNGRPSTRHCHPQTSFGTRRGCREKSNFNFCCWALHGDSIDPAKREISKGYRLHFRCLRGYHQEHLQGFVTESMNLSLQNLYLKLPLTIRSFLIKHDNNIFVHVHDINNFLTLSSNRLVFPKPSSHSTHFNVTARRHWSAFNLALWRSLGPLDLLPLFSRKIPWKSTKIHGEMGIIRPLWLVRPLELD